MTIDTLPECKRPDGFCPAHLLKGQAQNELRMGSVSGFVAKWLKENDGDLDERIIEEYDRDTARYKVTGKALKRKIERLRNTGELCSRCSY